jgi:SRSO17 transposase
MVAERWQNDEAKAAVLERRATAWDRLREWIAHRFGQVEVRLRVRRFVAGLLGRVERQNGRQVVEPIGDLGPQGVQRLLRGSSWDAVAVRDDLRAYVLEQLGEDDGVLIIDETGSYMQDKLGHNRQFARRHTTVHQYVLRALVSCGRCTRACTARMSGDHP